MRARRQAVRVANCQRARKGAQLPVRCLRGAGRPRRRACCRRYGSGGCHHLESVANGRAGVVSDASAARIRRASSWPEWLATMRLACTGSDASNASASVRRVSASSRTRQQCAGAHQGPFGIAAEGLGARRHQVGFAGSRREAQRAERAGRGPSAHAPLRQPRHREPIKVACLLRFCSRRVLHSCAPPPRVPPAAWRGWRARLSPACRQATRCVGFPQAPPRADRAARGPEQERARRSHRSGQGTWPECRPRGLRPLRPALPRSPPPPCKSGGSG